jgi:hypothetical protein
MPAARPRQRTRAAAHGKAAQRNKKWDKQLRARGGDDSGTYKKKKPSLARRPASPAVSATARWRLGTQRRAHKARHATTTRMSGATRGGGNAVLTYGQKGPDGEGVGVEGLDAVAAWCSEAEGGDVHGVPVRLLRHEWLRLGEDGAFPLTTNPPSSPPPLLLRQRQRDWGEIPERLRFAGRWPRRLLYRWW